MRQDWKSFSENQKLPFWVLYIIENNLRNLWGIFYFYCRSQLQSESKKSQIKNQMIVNPDKFQVIIIDEKRGDHTNENAVIDNK